MPRLQGAVLYNIQVPHFPAKYSETKPALQMQRFSGFYMYLQPMDRFTVCAYMETQFVFVQGWVQAFLHACVRMCLCAL